MSAADRVRASRPAAPRRVRRAALAVAAAILAGVGFTSSPTAGRTAEASSGSDWLATVNGYRAMSGLAPVTANGNWSFEATAHSCYMLLNGMTHDEIPGRPGYTAGGDAAGNAGNVAMSAGSTTTARDFVDLWMTGPFHAIGLLRPGLRSSGYGECRNPNTSFKSAATLDVVRGLDHSVARPATPIVFPGRNARIPLRRFIAESPNPVTMCGWQGSAGLPLIAMMPAGFSSASASLVGPGGALETCVLHGGNVADAAARRILQGDNAVVVVPRAPLVEGRYTASVNAGGQSTTWTFEVDVDAPIPASLSQPTGPLSTTSAVTKAERFQAVTPYRATDTRHGLNGSRLRAGVPQRFRVAPQGGDVAAVSANFTVAEQAEAGFITVYDCSPSVPGTSTLNFDIRPAAAQALVPVRSGEICVSSSVDADLVIDVNGFMRTSGDLRFTPVSPSRAYDSRSNPDALGLVPGTTRVVDLHGTRGVPAGAGAVAINVTAVGPDRPGFITVWPCGVSRPVVSNVNFVGGQTRANAAVVPLPGDGRLCMESDASTNVIVDVTGSFSEASGSAFTGLAPIRMLDTRQFDDRLNAGLAGGPNPGSGVIEVPLAGVRGVPANASAVAVTVTAVAPSAGGYATVFPCGSAPPNASTVNFSPDTYATANGALVKVGAGGAICVMTDVSTHFLVDITGVFG